MFDLRAIMRRLLVLTALIISCNAFSNGYDDYQNRQYQQDMLRQQREQMRQQQEMFRQQQEQNAQIQMQQQAEFEANKNGFRRNNNF